MKKYKKKQVESKSLPQIRGKNTKPSLKNKNPQIDLSKKKDIAVSKHGIKEGNETPVRTDLSELNNDVNTSSNFDDQLYCTIFGKQADTCQTTASKHPPLSLSEEILTYIDKNQRFCSDEGFRKYVQEKGLEKNNQMPKRDVFIHKDCLTNPNSDFIAPSSLNVAYVKGVIYRREIYGPPNVQEGQAGPSQVPISTENYTITKDYGNVQMNMPANLPLGCSCVPFGKDFGLNSRQTANPVLDRSPKKEQSSKNVTKTVKRRNSNITKKQTGPKRNASSKKSSNRKVSGKKVNQVKKAISKKGIPKTSTFKQKSIASRKGNQLKTKKSLKKKTGGLKKSKTSSVDILDVKKKGDSELPPANNNFYGCTCGGPWINDFGMCSPCPPCPRHYFPCCNHRQIEENCNNPIGLEKQVVVNDSVQNLKKKFSKMKARSDSRSGEHVFIPDKKKKGQEKQSDKKVKKKSSRSKSATSIKSDDTDLTPSGKTNANKKAKVKKKISVSSSKLLRASKNTKKEKSSKTIGKHDKSEKIKKTNKKKPRKSKQSLNNEDEDDGSFSTSNFTPKTKVKRDKKSSNNGKNNDLPLFLTQTKDGSSNTRIAVKRDDESMYNITFRDNGDMKVQVEQVISGMNRVLVYKSNNETDVKGEEVVEKVDMEKDAQGSATDVLKIKQPLSIQKNIKTPLITDSVLEKKKINMKIQIPKSLIMGKMVTRGDSIHLSNTSAAPSVSSYRSHRSFRQSSTTALQDVSAFVHPSAAPHNDEVGHKRDHKKKDTFPKYNDPELQRANIALLQETLQPIFEKLQLKEVGFPEEPDYTAKVNTDKCIVEGNKIECLTSIPHIKVVFDIPGSQGKKTEIVRPIISTEQHDVHVDVGLDRIGPKFLEQMNQKGVPFDPILSAEDVHNLVRKRSQTVEKEDETFRRSSKGAHFMPLKPPQESTHVGFTDQKNYFNGPNKLGPKLYDDSCLFDIKECINKLKRELRNDCPCFLSCDEEKEENDAKDARRPEEGSKELDKEFKSDNNKEKQVQGDLQNSVTEKWEHKQTNDNNISTLKSDRTNEEGKKDHEDRDVNAQRGSLLGSKQQNNSPNDADHELKKNIVAPNVESSELPETTAATTTTKKATRKLSLDNKNDRDDGQIASKNPADELNVTDERKNLNLKQKQPNDTFFQGQNLLMKTDQNPADSLAKTNNENRNENIRIGLTNVNKNKTFVVHANKVSKDRTTVDHRKNTVMDMTKSAFDKKALVEKKQKEVKLITLLDGKKQKEDKLITLLDGKKQKEDKLITLLDGKKQKEDKLITLLDGKKQKEDKSKTLEVGRNALSDANAPVRSLRNKHQPASVYHKGNNIPKGVPSTSHNDSPVYRPYKMKNDSKEGHPSSNTQYSRKKKQFIRTGERKEVIRFSGKPQKKTEANKHVDVAKADTVKSSEQNSGGRKLPKFVTSKKAKLAETKPKNLPSQVGKKGQEKKRSNGVSVEKVWADHRLEKAILAERYNQVKRSLNSKCCPDLPMKICCNTICPPKILICKYRCPSCHSPQ